MIHKSRTNTTPKYLLVVPYNRASEKQEERRIITESDEEPDLEFIAEGTKSIMIRTGILALICPHDEYCPKTDVDLNCFYEKFLHCNEARVLERTHILNQVDKFYLRYRSRLFLGELLRSQ